MKFLGTRLPKLSRLIRTILMVRYAAREGGAWLLQRRRRFRVQGPSMLPTLKSGEFVLVNPLVRPSAGDLVIVDHPTKPIRLAKRVNQIHEGGMLELGSDNVEAGSDSRHFGLVASGSVHGVVSLCLSAPGRSLQTMN